MKLTSITANCHIIDGQPNGRPLRLLLRFDENRTLRLRVAGDGEQLIADNGALDHPFDMAEYGQVATADLTASMFAPLCGVDVTDVHALLINSMRVGAKLDFADGEVFYFWVSGDEIYWGDEAAIVNHDWLNGEVPRAAERIEV